MNTPTGHNYRFPSREFTEQRWVYMVIFSILVVVPAVILGCIFLPKHPSGWEPDSTVVSFIGFFELVGIVMLVLSFFGKVRTLSITDTTITLRVKETVKVQLNFSDLQPIGVVGQATVTGAGQDYGIQAVGGGPMIVIGSSDSYPNKDLIKAMIAERVPDGIAPIAWIEMFHRLQ